MKKTKSLSSYTHKWLNRNKNLWEEIPFFYNWKVTKIKLKDEKNTPKIVIKRVGQINLIRLIKLKNYFFNAYTKNNKKRNERLEDLIYNSLVKHANKLISSEKDKKRIVKLFYANNLKEYLNLLKTPEK